MMSTMFKKTIIAVCFLFSGCYSGISGTVVDVVTGNPIDGAVVLVQWTTTHGIGLTHHSIDMVEESETNTEGKFSISGNYNPFIDPPQMLICKKGYVPWRNDMTFEKMETYDKIIWRNNMIYKLGHWKEEYSYAKLSNFIYVSGSNTTITPIFSEYDLEISKMAQIEIDIIKSKRHK